MSGIASFLNLFVVSMLMTSIAMSPVSAKSKDPIRIGVSDQTRHQIVAHIIARTLSKAGFKSQFATLGDSQLDMLVSGAAHVNMAFSPAGSKVAFDRALAEKEIYSLGGLETNAADEAELKVIWSGVRRKWPNAEKMLKTIILKADDFEQISTSIDTGNVTLEQSVDKWMLANRPAWKRWLTAAKNWMKP